MADTGAKDSSAVASRPNVGRRDPYDVLGLPRDSTEQQVKSTYRKLALKYHPDKNTGNSEAAEKFKEVAYSYGILSDVEKRRQYDTAGYDVRGTWNWLRRSAWSTDRCAGCFAFAYRHVVGEENSRISGGGLARFQAVDLEGLDMELDLSSLGTVNTMFAALFSKLGVPIKTTISATILEEALNGTVTIRPLPLGRLVNDKVEKQGAHFFGITISETQAEAGVVIRVVSTAQSKFKLLYFEQEENGGLGLALQEDSVKTGKVTSAGMYFLHFQAYRLDPTVNALAVANDPDAVFFKRLEGLQPCEVSALNAGTHIFAVYGDNFFKSASYTIEAICAEAYLETVVKLKDIEAQLLSKRNELRRFECEYRETFVQVLARFQAATNKYTQEKEAVDELLKTREKVHEFFTSIPAPPKRVSSSSSSNNNDDKGVGEDSAVTADESDSPTAELNADKANKSKWFNLNLKTSMSSTAK